MVFKTIADNTSESSQEAQQQGFTSSPENASTPCLASCLAFLSEKHPDLAAVASQWPTLPEHVRQTILAIIKSMATGHE